MRPLGWLPALLTMMCVPQAAPALGQPADLVLRGGVVITCDADNRQAQAVAVRDGRVIAVGDNDAMTAWIADATQVVELNGRAVVPGFIEGHGHFLSLGETKLGLELSRAKSWREIVEKVAEQARGARPGEWIIGRGWHQEKWTRPPQENGSPYPTHQALSQAAPDNPVLLLHGTGHMSVANAKAMEAAGVDRQTSDPRGGEILRDAAGEPTGVFRETAQSLPQRAYQQYLSGRASEQAEADALRAIDRAVEECLAHGVTSFQDAGSSFAAVDRYRRLADMGRLPIRLWIMLRASPAELEERLAEYRTIDHADGRLTVRAIKCMADGALGSHGAWMLEPYADLPQGAGLIVQPLEQIRRTGRLALEHGYQLCTHAIGDRANREVLNVYEELFRGQRDPPDLRWRIEHAQHLHPRDIPRFGDLGVIASMQACHAASDGPFVVARLGEERARSGAYAWRSVLDAGGRIVNGTDAPVESLSPIENFYAAVTRTMANGEPFFAEQRMTRIEALRSMTIDAAWGAFEEKTKGSIEPGKLADLVVLSQNPLTAPDDDLLKTRVVHTILGGKVHTPK